MSESDQEIPGLTGELLVVNDEPYGVWSWDYKERNQEFVKGLDSGYFPFLIDLFLASEDEKRASIGLRTTFHHSLETLFSLLGAYMQAPDCVYGWLAKCSTPSLRDVTRRISAKDATLYSRWKPKPLGWEAIARIVFRHYMAGTPKQEETIVQFGKVWERLAHEFLNQDNTDEYNSIKHGLRFSPGGFALQFGPHNEDGTPPAPKDMQSLGGSKFGSSFFRMEKIGNEESRNLSPRRISLNWKIERIMLQVQLAATSLQNVVGSLRILSGEPPGTVQYFRPIEDADFDRAWTISAGVTRMNFDFVIDPSQIPELKRQDLVARMNKVETPT
jgi:hypothetical protein